MAVELHIPQKRQKVRSIKMRRISTTTCGHAPLGHAFLEGHNSRLMGSFTHTIHFPLGNFLVEFCGGMNRSHSFSYISFELGETTVSADCI